GPSAQQRRDPFPPPLRATRGPAGRPLRVRPLHVLVLDRSRAALVVDAPPRPGDDPSDVRGTEGPRSRLPDLLRGHGSRGPRKRRAAGLPPAAHLSDGLPAGTAGARRPRRRLRADGLVLRLQTPSQARRRAPPAADGGGPPPALGRTHSPPGPPARPRVAKPEEMAKLTLKRGADRRLRAGHLWVYRSEVAGLAGHWSPASPVDVVDAAGTFLGRGFYNPRPSLACRLLTRRDELIDGEFFLRR